MTVRPRYPFKATPTPACAGTTIHNSSIKIRFQVTKTTQMFNLKIGVYKVYDTTFNPMCRSYIEILKYLSLQMLILSII